MRLAIGAKFALAATLVLIVAPGLESSDTKTSSANQQPAEASDATSQEEIPKMSDREKAGLRGPVESCTVENTTPAGPRTHAWRTVTTTKYDPDGRAYETGYVNNDGTKGVQSLTYDSEGHLLRAAWNDQAGERSTIYNYDSQGRLTSITGQGDWTTTFEYDDQGPKTRIVKSTREASTAENRSPFGVSIDTGDDLFIAPPPGGSVKTSYNERDQALESRVYASDGELMSRLTRAYDAKGRVAELSYVIENLGLMFSPETRERAAAEPGALEELSRPMVMVRISYSYDDQNRVAEKHDHTGFARETVTKITYNDHGDEIEEISTATGHLNPPESEAGGGGSSSSGALRPKPLPDEHTDVRFDYQYDSVGNWTEKTVSSPADGDKPARTWSVTRRTITYY
jgi:YD repeat-containing protein